MSSATAIQSPDAAGTSASSASPINAEPSTTTAGISNQPKNPATSANALSYPLSTRDAPARVHSLSPEVLLSSLWRSPENVHQIAWKKAGGAFQHHAAPGVPQAIAKARKLTAEFAEVYLACAEYISSTNRTAANVRGTFAFWVDLDCGKDKAATGKGYAHVEDAYAAIKAFTDHAQLPAPTHIVESGGGLHAYWVLDTFVEQSRWQATAGKLKALASVCNLLADPARTADIASVMRLPGTLNRKYDPPRPVNLVQASPSFIRTDALLAAIETAYARLCSAPPGRPPSEKPVRSREPITYGPPNLSRLSAALAFLDPDCEEYSWKLRRIGPLARAARDYPEKSSDLRKLASSWSSGALWVTPSIDWTTPGSDGIAGAKAFDKVWSRFIEEEPAADRHTLATIFHDADLAGWNGCPREGDAVDLDEAKLALSKQVLDALLARVKGGDVGAHLEPENVAELRDLMDRNPAGYQRYKNELKTANPKLSLTALGDAVKQRRAEGEAAPTHHGYAKNLVERLTVDGYKPVGHEGSIYLVDRAQNIWLPQADARLESLVAENYDNRPNCSKRSDYKSIAAHATSLALVGNESFFAQASIGVACSEGFHRLEGDEVVVEPLTPAHRQRVLLNFTPRDEATPLFDTFLHETFVSASEGEEEQQVALVQEIAGAVMLGLMPRYQKAVLFYDPYGRAGKGTLESIIRNLVPPNFVTAVSPFVWDQPYFLMSMAGARLNVVAELPENQSIPAAVFKSVLGGDPLTGRNPAGRPICFKNSAGHIFMSNHLINSRDQSEAFFARWLIVEFPNSRLKSGLPLDPTISDRIAKQELPGIAHWALEGAKRLLRNNGFSVSAAHVRVKEKWRRTNSSVEEFVFECCELAPEHHLRRAAFYDRYKDWCGDNTRRPFAKSKVKELLEHNVGLGVSHAMLNGYEVFRGVRLKPSEDFELQQGLEL